MGRWRSIINGIFKKKLRREEGNNFSLAKIKYQLQFLVKNIMSKKVILKNKNKNKTSKKNIPNESN